MRRGHFAEQPDTVNYVASVRDKHSTRTTMAEAGLPTPRNFLIEKESQVEEAAELVKFPAGAIQGLCIRCRFLSAEQVEKTKWSRRSFIVQLPAIIQQHLSMIVHVVAAKVTYVAHICSSLASVQSFLSALCTWSRYVDRANNRIARVAVIKPIYGAASIGVVKVTNLVELKATYTRVNKEMAGARIVAGAITTGEEADGEEASVRIALRTWTASLHTARGAKNNPSGSCLCSRFELNATIDGGSRWLT